MTVPPTSRKSTPETQTRGEVGLLLPTFDRQAQRERVLRAARDAEAFGFGSVWVRDHLFIPRGTLHGGIKESGFHLEPLMALASVASVTSRIKLGTAVLIPLRHPLSLVQLLGTLGFMSGGRVVAGLGLGAFEREFSAVGLDYSQRRKMVQETLEILRIAQGGGALTHRGEVYQFEGVTIDPVPPAHMPVWYGGSGSPRSAKLAFDFGFEGWMGNAPADVFDRLVELTRSWETEHGRKIALATIPIASVAKTREKALGYLDLDDLVVSISKNVRKEYSTFDDVASALVVGTPSQAAEQIRAFWDKGVSPVILDLRVVGEAFEEVLGLIGEEVMPLLGEDSPN
jgi:alkanesulfonate monooxygenase SsuD/methylene tetrahydromethanopterin reductase-like flavin-dependent oxidoreductase (luciferase family)